MDPKHRADLERMTAAWDRQILQASPTAATPAPNTPSGFGSPSRSSMPLIGDEDGLLTALRMLERRTDATDSAIATMLGNVRHYGVALPEGTLDRLTEAWSHIKQAHGILGAEASTLSLRRSMALRERAGYGPNAQ